MRSQLDDDLVGSCAALALLLRQCLGERGTKFEQFLLQQRRVPVSSPAFSQGWEAYLVHCDQSLLD